MKIKVAIADDHPLVVSGLKLILDNSNNMELAGTYSNGMELLAGLKQRLPDVLVLDIHMPGQKGDELAETIIAAWPELKVLVVTNEDSVFYVKSLLRKGVHGYILKTTSEPVLLEAITTVFDGGQYIETAMMRKVMADTLQAQKKNAAIPELTEREKEVLRYIAQDLTSQQIAAKIFVSKRTVDYYRLSMLAKLGVKNVGALVKKGIQLGIIE
jgi:DNA-binding NarL/FixJ family response regulator